MTTRANLREESLSEYLAECTEMLERFSKSLTILESNENTQELLAAIYRDIHTIKGSSQLFGFTQISTLAHAMETCLDPLRKTNTAPSSTLIDSLYASSDLISNLLAGIKENKTEPDLQEQISYLVARYFEVVERDFSDARDASPNSNNTTHKDSPKEQNHSVDISKNQKADSEKPVSKVSHQLNIDSIPGFGIFEDSPPSVSLPIDAPPKEPKREKPVLPDSQTSPMIKSTPKSVASASKPTSDEAPAETIRVHVALLDILMNLVGEQVLIRNQLLQYAKVNDTDSELGKLSQRLNILTAELQNEVMKTRMQPIGNILGKFTRVVRDLGRDLGKKIELVVEGTETELDKTIIEAIKDPLTHIVRNAVDHGIESVEDRLASEKPETGLLRIKANHENGHVIIEVIDDGRGLDRQKIAKKAIEKGLITAEFASKLSDREIQFMIFSPGFSTAESISNISGRGVGMDVVKTNIEHIGGTVELTSQAGLGTTIKLKIPLTLAVVPALIVRSLGQKFVIPQNKLVELVMIEEGENQGEKIEFLQGSPVLRLRGQILPLLNLSEILSKSNLQTGHPKETIKNFQSTNIVVLNAENCQFGLIVDAIEDTADVVVKALSPFLKDLTFYSGATIMGDGSVALTIDVMGLSTSAKLSANNDQGLQIKSPNQIKSRHQIDAAEYLLVDVGVTVSYAIPLTVVSRLEDFSIADIEYSGEQKVFRYRDTILPIFSLPDILQLPNARKIENKETIPVVVVRRGENYFGIEVHQIRDVVAMPSRIDQTVRDRPGILGTLLTENEVLVVVDILGIIDAQKTKLAANSGHEISQTVENRGSGIHRRQFKILVTEDSSFFRNYVGQVIAEAGYQVETACDGQDAWEKLDKSQPGHYSLVLSDIEMPIMDGLELGRKVSSDPRFKKVPLVAITTRFGSADIENGYQAGFTRYLEKLNAEKLISELDALLISKAA